MGFGYNKQWSTKLLGNISEVAALYKQSALLKAERRVNVFAA
jgi:hypothetical protein